MPEPAQRFAEEPTADHLSEVDRIVEACGRNAEALIPILQAMQETYHYLPPWAMRRVADTTNITPADITGVATFYKAFRHRPAGKHCMKVCVGTACHVKGADRLTDAIRRHLEIPDDGDTDDERMFTVEEVACLGCCMLAPVARIDEMTYGNLVPHQAAQLLLDFLTSREPAATAMRTRRPVDQGGGVIRCCLCSSCKAAGADELHEELERLVDEMQLPARVKVVGCTGLSSEAPLIQVACDSGAFQYGAVRVENIRTILLEHFQPAGIRRRVAVSMRGWFERFLTDEAWEPVTRFGLEPRETRYAESDQAQVPIATEHAGRLAPLGLEEYLQHDGFEALGTCLHDLSPEDVIGRIEQSGLRGRGGAGFPTGIKWGRVREQSVAQKVVICNTPSAPPRASSTSGPSTRWRRDESGRHSRGARNQATWATA